MNSEEVAEWARLVRARSEAMRDLPEEAVRIELGACAAQLVARLGLEVVAADLEQLAGIYRARAERDRRGMS